MSLPPVSILVCTRDRRAMLDTLLVDLHAQDYDGQYEITVIEETDDPRPIEDVNYVPHPVMNKGIAFTRNLAIKHAAHDLIVFVDDDCQVETDWLRRLVQPLDDPQVLGVQGGVTVPDGTNAVGWAETLLGFPGGGVSRIHHSGGKIQETREISTLNAAYRKQALLDAGGFDAAARFGGEDYLLAKKVASQGRLLFVPDAVVRHAARGSLLAIWRWFMRRGMAEAAMLRAGIAPSSYGGFMLRSSLGLKLLCAVALGWWSWWPILLLVLFIAGRTVWKTRWVFGRRDVPAVTWLWVPWVKILMDIATDAGRLHRPTCPAMMVDGDNTGRR
ncbi:MAG: hypothetical protein BMS9Abin18_0928 [Zetaproteobacteria bacterium]|nr:MAG: hypothetical protein BMS9Abin18_0928 [Zetaproteobacteria bacterium]